MKRHMPDSKVIYMDAHFDIGNPINLPSRNANRMVMSFLTGNMVGYEQWRCLDLAKDVCFIGTRSCLGEESELVEDSRALVI